MALLRLLSNARGMGPDTLHPERAWEVVGELIGDPRVVVIEQPPLSHASYWLACVDGRVPSPDLWTDAWLAALALATDSERTTFDRGFLAFNKLKLRLLTPDLRPSAPFRTILGAWCERPPVKRCAIHRLTLAPRG